MKDIIAALLKGWDIGASTVRTVAVVERLTAVLDKGNALESLSEISRRLQHYDDVQLLTNRMETLSELVRSQMTASGASRRFEELNRAVAQSDCDRQQQILQLETRIDRLASEIAQAAAVQSIRNDSDDMIGDDDPRHFYAIAFGRIAHKMGFEPLTDPQVVLEATLRLIAESRSAEKHDRENAHPAHDR